MALRKIDLMHRIFGVSDGHTCRECSESSDWAGRWQACGMFNREWDKQPVMRELFPERKEADNTPWRGR